jgi:hypothetical protein
LKKVIAILLLGVFSFNWVGYRLMTSILEDHADAILEGQLDQNEYDESELISIKIPANLPYLVNSPDFSRVDGEITINGVHYNYVKQRVYNDSLEYLCIPNREKTRLHNAKDEFYKVVNDLQHPSQNKKSGHDNLGAKNLLSEYFQDNKTWAFKVYSPEFQAASSFYLVALLQSARSPDELPPDAC